MTAKPADQPVRALGGVVDCRGHSGRLGAPHCRRRRLDDRGVRRAARARTRVAHEPAGPRHLGLVRHPRRDRARRLRHGLPGPRRDPEPRGRPQGDPAARAAAAGSGSGAERGTAAGPAEPSERGAGVQGRAARPGRGRGDGAAPRPHLRRTRHPSRGVQRPRGHARRRGHLLRAGRGARGTPGARRRQGPERHARRRRPHGADGFRRRLRREDRRPGEPPLRRHAALSRPRGVRGQRPHARSRTSTVSASCSIYLATGHFPVEGNSGTEVRRKHEAGGPRRLLRDVRADLPDAFIHVVERATAERPGERYQTAGELEAALQPRPPPRRSGAPPEAPTGRDTPTDVRGRGRTRGAGAVVRPRQPDDGPPAADRRGHHPGRRRDRRWRDVAGGRRDGAGRQLSHRSGVLSRAGSHPREA